MPASQLLQHIHQLIAIADTGLLYNKNEYDKERYNEIRELALRLLQTVSNHSIDNLKLHYTLASDYPTAKVDVRGLLLGPDGKILLARESADGKWSLPGGWADVGYTPKEVIVKEFKEETGLDVEPQKLLAVFDKKMHPHPPQPFYVYKLVFYCTAANLQINKGFDVLDVDFFDVDNLPPLSEDRILQSQIKLLYQKVTTRDFEAYFD